MGGLATVQLFYYVGILGGDYGVYLSRRAFYFAALSLYGKSGVRRVGEYQVGHCQASVVYESLDACAVYENTEFIIVVGRIYRAGGYGGEILAEIRYAGFGAVHAEIFLGAVKFHLYLLALFVGENEHEVAA